MRRYNELMRRLRLPSILGLVWALIAAVPAYADAPNLPLLNPNFSIVPKECLSCACDYGMLLQLVQNLMNAGISVGIIGFTLALALAGWNFMTNPTNPEKRGEARGMLLNIVIGMVILLAAWLGIDFIMKVIYSDTNYGPWNSILGNGGSGSPCIQASTTHGITGLPQGVSDALTGVLGGPSGGGGGGATLSTSGKGACNASSVASAAASGGVRMSSQEANILACVAGPESTCGAKLQNYSWNIPNAKGDASTAYGPFQITLKGNSACFENSTCYQAAGVSGPLNCASAFDNHGFTLSSQTTRLHQCQAAAANLACSAVAADCVYRKQGTSAWTKDPNSSKQQACISNNGG